MERRTGQWYRYDSYADGYVEVSTPYASPASQPLSPSKRTAASQLRDGLGTIRLRTSPTGHSPIGGAPDSQSQTSASTTAWNHPLWQLTQSPPAAAGSAYTGPADHPQGASYCRQQVLAATEHSPTPQPLQQRQGQAPGLATTPPALAPSCWKLLERGLRAGNGSAAADVRTMAAGDAGERLRLYTGLPFYAILMLELLGLSPDSPACSADLLRGLAAAGTEGQLLAVLQVMAARGAERAEAAGAGGSSAGKARNGGGSGGGGGAADPEEARRRVSAEWDKLRRGGVVWVAAEAEAGRPAGHLSYAPAAPQRPPYRTLVGRAQLMSTGPGSRPGRGRAQGTPGCWARSSAGEDVALSFSLEVSNESSYLARHPLLGAHDRLLRLQVDAGAALEGGQGERELARKALEQLATSGLVFAGRLYRYLMHKDSDLWFLAVRSARPEDVSAWAPMQNPIMACWPLLGAAVTLPSCQAMAVRAELWASKTVPLPLHGWDVWYQQDREAPGRTAADPPIKLTDGAGRASLDLWDLLAPAWAAHSEAADAAAVTARSLRHRGRRALAVNGAAAGDAAATSGGRRCMPVQVRLHHALLPGRPRVTAKGMLSPDAGLPPRTILLPYSCVKAPGRQQLEAWVREAGAAAAEDGGDSPWAEDSERSGSGWRLGQHTPPRQLHPASATSAGAARVDGSNLVLDPGATEYSAEVQLECVNCGVPVTEGRLNSHMVLLLHHQGLSREFLQGLLASALQEIADVTSSPASALAALGGFPERFGELRDRLAAGWGYTSEATWDQPDAHLCHELRSLQEAMLNGLKEMRIPLPASFMAVGVPDHSACLPRRCVCLINDHGHSQVLEPRRCLLYRDPDLRPGGLLAAWLVPPPPKLMQGFGPGLQSALVMPVQGDESLAALMAGGDYDGDVFHIITHDQVIQQCWERLAEQQEVARNWAEVDPPQTQALAAAAAPGAVAGASAAARTALAARTARPFGGGPADIPAGPSTPTPTTPGAGAGAGPAAARPARTPSFAQASSTGQLWTLRPQKDDEGGADLIRQLVQFFLHCAGCSSLVGTFHSLWVRAVEAPPEQGGGVGGPLCAALAGACEAALDAKKHSSRPQLPDGVEARCKSLPDPPWAKAFKRKQLMAGAAAAHPPQSQQPQPRHGGSIVTTLLHQVQAHAAAQQLQPHLRQPGAPGPREPGWSRAMEPHVRLVAVAREVVGEEAGWRELLEVCWRVVAAEWSRPWARHLEAEKDGGRKATAGNAGGGSEAFGQELVRRVRLGLLAGARHILPGRLQLGNVSTETGEAPAEDAAEAARARRSADMLDGLGSRVALATALYAAVYSRRAEEGITDGSRLGVVWQAAGEELNFAHYMLRSGGQLPGIRPSRDGGTAGRRR